MDVSVIIPVYNNEEYLEKCLNSIINQTTDYKYEIIVINDGSTDNSLDILKKYKNKIKLIDQENKGPGAARNAGLLVAKGKYLMFIDGDDYVSSDFIEKMIDTLENNKSDIVICDFYRVNNDNISYLSKGKAGIYYKGKINDVLLMDFHSCNKAFKKELFKNLKYPEGMFYEDVVLISKVLLRALKIVKINNPLYYYRNNVKGTTNVINYTNYDIYEAINMIESDFKKNGYLEEIEYMYINGVLVDLLIKIIKSNDPDKRTKFYKLKNEIIDKYPSWYKNKYIKSCKFLKRMYLYCLKKDYYKLINFMFNK